MKTKTKIICAILALILIIILISGKIIIPKKPTQYEINNPGKKSGKENMIRSVDLKNDKAPEIINKGIWINSDKPLSIDDLKGKVVLIEFWTFGCYNCTNTLPYLKAWYNKYKSDQFEMIGIHCPEFDNERDLDNVKEKVKDLGIEYPVLTDNAFTVWNKYDVHAWPTIFIIDKNGEVKYKKVGEGSYEKTEQVIQELLEEKTDS